LIDVSEMTDSGRMNKEWSCPNGHHWQVWDAGPVQCPDCGLSGSASENATLAPPAITGVDLATPEAPRQAHETTHSLPVIPGYDVVEVLGRGGMGVVYRAKHKKLNRVVAIKMLLGGTHAAGEDLARFRTEAEAAARLQHPGIVQIYEIGDHDGLPYLALEYCAGGSLERRLNATPIPPRVAAELIEQLARAIHAAHQQGVVHRDLKPANILLSPITTKESRGEGTRPSDEKSDEALNSVRSLGLPKIADFGLAKLTGEAGQTRTGAVMGTPSYMAPEQAGGPGGNIGPASDTYALGAILYELLTGRPPFKAATPLDTIVQLISEDPVPPSRLQSRTPHDLEVICLHCLRKDPGQRYASAVELAQDLRRFLENQPVKARPASLVEKAAKWTRRRPAAAALLFVSALALTVLAAGWLEFTWRLGRERDLADAERREADNQRQLALSRQREAEDARQEAVENFALAREAVEKYSTQVTDDLQLRQEDLRPLRQQLLETALPFFEKLAERHAANPALQAERAKTYQRLASLTSEIGAKPKALERYLQALDAHEKLVRDHPDEPAHRAALANLRNEMGTLYLGLSQVDKSEAAFRQSIADWQELTQQFPNETSYGYNALAVTANLAVLHMNAQRWKQSEALFRETIDQSQVLLGKGQTLPAIWHSLAKDHINLGNVYRSTNRLAQARTEFEKAIEIQRKLVHEFPSDFTYQDTLAQGCNYLGSVLAPLGQVVRGEQLLEEALALNEVLARKHPSVTAYAQALASTYLNLAPIYQFLGKKKKSIDVSQKAMDLFERVHRDQPQLNEVAVSLAGCYCNRGAFESGQGRRADALDWFNRASALLEPIYRREPGLINVKVFLLNTCVNKAVTLGDLRRDEEASKEFERAVALSEGPVRENMRVGQAGSYVNVGHVLRDKGKPADALPWYEKGIAMLTDCLQRNPTLELGRRNLSIGQAGCAAALFDLKRYPESLPHWDKALELAPQHPTWRLSRAATLARLKQGERAFQEAEEVARGNNLSGADLYNLACVYGAAATSTKSPMTDQYADRALSILHRAAEAGHFKNKQHVDWAQKDPDLANVRRRPGWATLVKDWGSSAK
jgi:serine/threonine-protein kinase